MHRKFLDLITAAGGHQWACRMSADMMHLDEDDKTIISVADFVELSAGAQLLFI